MTMDYQASLWLIIVIFKVQYGIISINNGIPDIKNMRICTDKISFLEIKKNIVFKDMIDYFVHILILFD